MLSTTHELQQKVLAQEDAIAEWLHKKMQDLSLHGHHLPVYSSFDFRDCGWKATIVDSNAFPSGFNNLDERAVQIASRRFKEFFDDFYHPKSILIIPENHTRNLPYIENLHALGNILAHAGFQIGFGCIDDTASANEQKRVIHDSNGNELTIERVQRTGKNIFTESFEPDLILLNNDLSIERPWILDGIAQVTLPSIALGWHSRKKHIHLKHYFNLMQELERITGLDPWLLSASTVLLDNVDFSTKESGDRLIEAASALVSRIKEKYSEIGVVQEPYVFMKDNSGTYGIGVVSFHSIEEMTVLNSKIRKKMAAGKHHKPITSIILQEGVDTRYLVNSHTAEPVLYSVGGEIAGGFMRINKIAGFDQNLNSKGMYFGPLVDNEMTSAVIEGKKSTCTLYGLLAKIANLAITRELQDLEVRDG
jgi:glutamate--cysteine ligase